MRRVDDVALIRLHAQQSAPMAARYDASGAWPSHASHRGIMPLFCPTGQTLFGIAEIEIRQRFLLCMGLFSIFLSDAQL
ncbi:hypothetical protein UP06_02270 [Bradyrhizobium sp. LTSP857]|nr:hypothetical protein UP06_02270 [Bradyrhizobium sp. LTSP857]